MRARTKRNAAELAALQRRVARLRIASARHRLLRYCQVVDRKYRTPAHIRRIAAALERVATGRLRRLLVVLPPRHGKSVLISQRFPAWILGRDPTREIILSSYNDDLAAAFGRRLRNLIASEEHAAVFPDDGARLSVDSRAADEWHTRAGGVFRAAGVGGAITGRGADLFIVDDPFRSQSDADSLLQRNRVWDWWEVDAQSRLHPGAAAVVVSTRWHADDLVGRLLRGPESWELLHAPALSGEPPVALWPERFSAQELLERRAAMTMRRWLALYQGEPTQDGGSYFRADWLREYDPAELRRQWQQHGRDWLACYGASDYAVSAGRGDYTVHLVVGLDPAGTLYVLDVWRARTDPAAWIEAMLDRMDRYQTLRWAEEAGQIRNAIGPALAQRKRERQVVGLQEQFHSAQDKPTRARAIQARMELSGLYVPRGAPWRPELEAELLAFPTGRHDDIVDALSLMGRLLAQAEPGRTPAKAAPARPPGAYTLNELWAAEAARHPRRHP